ncbi:MULTISPECIES: J domain-containing protein [unclassified Candidatus Accumulibacter]|jgi:hypothetical protein|uniref:J domain-containing protein n=1 Tax=unclassified Candidatus Accumulibacter TaxID=2619054 RepID=UPI0012C73313|nr:MULTISPECIES: J domain-containing protein [unclassified Candidatus Accumulibacter]MQM35335.1 molecular chaperone DnaJ [Candidatus Accumulibacter phosphatis]
MLPEERELSRLEREQLQLADQVATAELECETTKTEIAQFQRRYYETVGRLFAEIDDFDAQIADALAGHAPGDRAAQARAEAAQEKARQSAEEAGLIEEQAAPPLVITPELKQAYRQAAKLMHPDRAITKQEIERRTRLMAQVNLAYQSGDQQAIERLVLEFGQDPEAISGEDVASRLVKVIRRIAQLRRRLGELHEELEELEQSELFQLKITVEESELLGGDPLGDLAQQLLQQLSERKIQLEMAKELLID